MSWQDHINHASYEPVSSHTSTIGLDNEPTPYISSAPNAKQQMYGQDFELHHSQLDSQQRLGPNNISPYKRGGKPWQPGFLRRLPFVGLGALCLAFLCMLASIFVLVESNGKLVADWEVTPNVILSILSAIFSASLSLALSEGATISWWHRALRGGTLADLSREWSFSTGIIASLLAGRNFSRMAMASIFVTTAVIAGPLLQRASSVVTEASTGNVTLHAKISPILPYGYTAIAYSLGDLGEVMPEAISSNFSTVMYEYNQRTPITSGITGCTGNCSAVVQAAGVSVSCGTPEKIAFKPNPQNQTDTEMFAVTTGYDVVNCTTECRNGQTYGGKELVTLSVSFTETTNCDGYRLTTTCNITQAVVEYQVNLSGDTITLDSSNAYLPEVAPYETEVNPQVTNSSLGGIYLASQDLFESNVTWYFQVASLYMLSGLGVFPTEHLEAGDPSAGGCQFTWRDPTTDILSAYNEIMFRTALRAAVNDSMTYNLTLASNSDKKTFTSSSDITGTQTTTQNVFNTNFKYLAAAIAVMVVGMLAVAPTFYGWWHLGQRVSMNPIGISNAFDSPIVAGEEVPFNADVNTLLNTVGDRKVIYTELEQLDGDGTKVYTMRRVAA
ncbi:hypothetical protein BP6252_09563 [Coleophoma cylindrospora]|uniref:Uncharacterized protein n=1 Tax=Coleophoma cylindrospora TaxID=1849047 RepID=A0A3D8R2B4_9HELO|nr:hypothetical protein BP6252_09563 [Coleophoma cylindrospora]